ncbi:MAG: S8 family serine peptidase, partial [Desulfobacterales bacterium]
MQANSRCLLIIGNCLTIVFLFFAASLEALELRMLPEMKSSREVLANRPPPKVLEDDRGGAVPVPGFFQTPPVKALKSAYCEGEVLVKFKKAAKAQEVLNSMFITDDLTLKRRFDVLSRVKLRDYVLVQSKKMSAAELVQNLKAHPQVELVSFNYVKYLDGTIPNDTQFDAQWSFNNTGQEFAPGYTGTPDADIDAPEVWDIQTGTEEVVVAVLDTGVDYLHPDLVDNMWVNQAEFSGAAGVDDDGNGYVDDTYGIDTGQNDTDPMDIAGHGTHVAGIIAAAGNNSLGMTGVNWNARIMAVKGFESDGRLYTDGELEAIEYILDMKQRGVNIGAVNASYGGMDFDPMQKDAIEALQDAGIIFVASAGNAGTDNEIYPHYPSDYDLDQIISVAATDWNDNLASFSNFGANAVDLGAPGVMVLSSYPHIFYWPAPGDLFFDDMESGSSQWTAEGTWTITAEQSLSPTHGWSDSPNGNYVENATYALISAPIDLSAAKDPRGPHRLGFRAKFELQEDQDFLEVHFRAPPSPSYWQLTTERAWSGAYAWSDSPGGNYPNDAESWLVSPAIDLTAADDAAKVTFANTGMLEDGYDFFGIHFSADGGATWSWKYTLSGDFSDQWYGWSAPIPPEFRTAQFRVAFALHSDYAVNYDGYYLDDIGVSDSSTTFFMDDMESGPNGWTTPDMSVWNYVGSLTGSTDGTWGGYNVKMTDEYLWNQFQFKFVVRSDSALNDDGVYLDDIGVGVPEILDH